MTFRAITASNDWSFGKGKGSYFTREKALAANIRTSLLFFINDCFFAMSFGLDWWSLLGAKGVAAKNNIILETRRVLASSAGVVRINSVDALVNADRSVSITYVVDTLYSRNVTGTIQTP